VATAGGVLVEQVIDTPMSTDREAEDALGGTMTVIVRSVVASEGRTVVTWALRWDDPEASDATSIPVDDFFNTMHPPVLTDGAALKYYYPLCPSDWHGTISSIYCRVDALFWPHQYSKQELVNHQTLEAWAVFPEVGKDTMTVDLGLPGGLPVFSELPVSRP